MQKRKGFFFDSLLPPMYIREYTETRKDVNTLNKPRGIEEMMRRISARVRHGLFSAVSLANCELLKEGEEDCHRRITVFRRKGRISRVASAAEGKISSSGMASSLAVWNW